MQQHQALNPFFIPIRRSHKTEEELNAPVNVVEIFVSFSFTKRGEHRKEVVESHAEAWLEVPEKFNRGHIKLAANRHVKNKLHGIRVREFHEDPEQVKKCEHKRKVRDFMSWQGIRDNETMKREYDREMAKRKAEADSMAAGIAPEFQDETQYGADGLPKFSEKTYVAQG
jgi:hypothetical protein